jgi:uncharacterized protein DUF6988
MQLFACLRWDSIPRPFLVRPMFETYVRGEWLVRRTERRVKKFLEREESLKLDKLIASLESTDDFEIKFLSEFKRKYWPAMCDYAHTGGRHIRRWLTSEGIQSNYSRGEILEVMKGAETIASLSIVTGLARLANDGDLQRRTMKVFERRKAQYASWRAGSPLRGLRRGVSARTTNGLCDDRDVGIGRNIRRHEHVVCLRSELRSRDRRAAHGRLSPLAHSHCVFD